MYCQQQLPNEITPKNTSILIEMLKNTYQRKSIVNVLYREKNRTNIQLSVLSFVEYSAMIVTTPMLLMWFLP